MVSSVLFAWTHTARRVATEAAPGTAANMHRKNIRLECFAVHHGILVVVCAGRGHVHTVGDSMDMDTGRAPSKAPLDCAAWTDDIDIPENTKVS